MTSGELERLPVELVQIFSDLEDRIMEDIVMRIRINGFSSATADWEITRLQQLGKSDAEIRQAVKDALAASDEQLDTIFSDAVYQEYYKHARAYKIMGVQQIPYSQNTPLQELVEAIRDQTRGTFRNMTQTMGFARRIPGTNQVTFTPLAQFYQSTLDSAILGIHSGAFSYQTELERVISTLTNSGLRTVSYANGYKMRIDSAARTALITGFRQIQGLINQQVAAALKTDSYEVTWHAGARPDHQPWQGRVYTMQQLRSVCGLGDVTGLCGANCYHNYDAFIPGVSVRTYTDEWLDAQNARENTPKDYNGKQYTTYEALQEQRRMERGMRKTRQDIRLLEAGNADAKTLTAKRARYRGQMEVYKDFSASMGLPEQLDRIFQDQLGDVSGRRIVVTGENVVKGRASERTKKTPVVKKFSSGIIRTERVGLDVNLQLFAEKDMYRQSSSSLKRAIRNYRKRIQEHEEKISNPEKNIDGWDNLPENKKIGLKKHWEKEKRNFTQSIKDRIEELKARGDYDGE